MTDQVVILDLYEGQILPWQIRARDDQHRFKVLVCGRKARKTTFMVNRLIKNAMTDSRGLTYPYIAPFRKQAKEIVWSDHVGRIINLCNKIGVGYQMNRSDLTIHFPGASTFKVDGADNAEALRGKSDWGGVAMDEYASWKPYVWQEIIRPNLQVHKAWGIFGGTPKGYGNDFYRVAKLGDRMNVIDSNPSRIDPDFATFHATSYDNIYLPDGEVDAAKRDSTVDYFNQEYLALFTRFTGLVYPEFNVNLHVESIDHIFDEHADYLYGLDFAVRGYTGMISGYMKSNGHYYIPPYAEYKEQNLTAHENAAAIKDILIKNATWNKWTGYADPAGWINNQQGIKNDRPMTWSLADEYLEDDFAITQANNEVNAGINYVRQMFKANKIHIDPTNTKLIEELMQYQWKEQKPGQVGLQNEPEKVRKFNDHLVDPLRYVLYSKPTAPEEEEQSRGTVFPGHFPPPKIEPVEGPDSNEIHPLEFESSYIE